MKKIHIPIPGRAARALLLICLPLILLSAIALLISYHDARKIDAVGANYYYPQLLEYILASITITAGGVLLTEATERDLERFDR